MPKSFTMKFIAEAVDGQLVGDGAIEIGRLAHPADIPGANDLVLAMDPKLVPLLEGKKPHAVIVNGKTQLEPGFAAACITVDRPRLAMAKLTGLFAVHVAVDEGIHPTAVIENSAKIGRNVSIGALAYIGAGAVIGDGSVLHPQTYVGPDAVIGRDALIYPGARVGARVEIGDRCIMHFNASIGADGFSFVTPQAGSVETAKATGIVGATNDELVRIASLGAVIIGDDVEIGASTTVDRGTIASTRIGNGTKLDNQVQIGHNVVIGENCLICGCAGVAGSAVIGNRVVIGGRTSVADHVKMGDDAVAMGMSGVASNVPPREVVGGFPAMPRARTIENLFNIGRLRQFYKKIDAFAERLNALEQKSKSD